MKKDVKVFVWDYEHEMKGMPTKPDEFIKFWQDKIALVPEEYRDSTKIEVDANFYYDHASLEMFVSYRRPETDSEYDVRIEAERLEQRRLKARELSKLEELKAKYELWGK